MKIICEDEGTSFEVEEGDYIEHLLSETREKIQTFLVQKDGIWSTDHGGTKKGRYPVCMFVNEVLSFGSTVMIKVPDEKPVLITDIV